MIERIGYENDGYADREAYCDAPGCDEIIELKECTFYELIDEIKCMGWKITKEGDEWTHYCEEHRGGY